jgi:two-component sensor histidine kinase
MQIGLLTIRDMMLLPNMLRRFRRLTLFQRYGLATGLLGLVAGIHWLLAPYLNSDPLLPIFLPIVISALFLRHGTGLYVAVAGSFTAILLFIEPWGLAIDSEQETVAVFILLAFALLLSPLLEAMGRLVDDFENTVQRQELLLRELRHRNKNNLQILIAMIMMQANQTRESTARAAVLAVGERISMLGQLQQRLDQPDENGAVNAAAFLGEVGTTLALTLGALRSVTIQVEAEKLSLPATVALPLGLIVNELVTNSVKYAFPKDRPGRVKICLRRVDGDTVELRVSDDGVGRSPTSSKGTGLTLISALVQQLGGTLHEEDAEPGFRMIIHLPLPE